MLGGEWGDDGDEEGTGSHMSEMEVTEFEEGTGSRWARMGGDEVDDVP